MILASLLITLTLQADPHDGGFKVEGDRIDTLKLTFHTAGLDRSSPEAAGKSILQVMATIRDTRFQLTVAKAQAATRQALFGSYYTEGAWTKLLEQSSKNLSRAEKNKYSSLIKAKSQKKNDDGSVLTVFEVKTQELSPCYRCEGKSGECKSCDGKGTRTRETTKERRIVLVQEGEVWLVQKMYESCSSCEGKGECRCKDEKEKEDQKCFRCGGSGTCKGCKGSGFREDKGFIRGPSVTKGLPPLKPGKPDFSSPKTLYQSFESVLILAGAASSYFGTNAAGPFQEFVNFLIAKKSRRAPRTREFMATTFEFVSVTKKGEDRATVQYKSRGSEYALEVIRTKVGDWKIDQLLEKCWGCRGTGKGRSDKDCRSCKGKGLVPRNHFPR